MSAPTLRTDRLVMRGWRETDREPYAAMNADPRVMEHFPGTMSRPESDAHVDAIAEHFARRGYGLWAVEVPGEAEFIGFVGLNVPRFEAHFTPAVEVGWRLVPESWGHGYATEAAREAVRFGFEDAGLAEIVSFTAPANERSQAVMRRLGMTLHGHFEHPRVPAGHPVRPHVVYRIARPATAAGTEAATASEPGTTA